MDMGVQFDVIAKSGSFFSYNGSKIAQGREKLRLYLKENPEVKAEIEQKIRDAAKGKIEEIVEEE
jgi:recombination protein RecA